LSTAPEHRHEAVGYIELLRLNSNFRLLWISQIISLLGDWFDLIASSALVASFTHSGSAIGGLFVVRMLAPFVVNPIAGVLADRISRKILLVATDVLRGFVVLGFLLVRTPEQAWLLYVITAIQTALTGVWFPARNAILPDVVSRRELGAANALSAATWSVMLSLGAALGGLAAGIWGVYPAFVIDSASFFLSALIVWRMQYRFAPGAESTRSLRGALTQYFDGLRYLRSNLDVFFVALQKSAVGLFVGGFQVVQVVIAERVFVLGDKGTTGLGWMYTLIGLGTGIGPILARQITGDRPRPLRIAIAVAYGIAALGLLLVAPLTSFGMVLFGTLLRGIGGGVAWVFSTQLLYYLTPDRVRGRVFATEFALQTLSNAVGAVAIGAVIDLPTVGIQGTSSGMALVTLMCGVLWGLWIFSPRGSGQVVAQEAQD